MEFFKVVFTEGNYDVKDQKSGLRKTVPLEKVFEVGKPKPITVLNTETDERITKFMVVTSIQFTKVNGAPCIVISAKPKDTDDPSYPLWFRLDVHNAKLHVDANMLYGFTILDFGDL